MEKSNYETTVDFCRKLFLSVASNEQVAFIGDVLTLVDQEDISSEWYFYYLSLSLNIALCLCDLYEDIEGTDAGESIAFYIGCILDDEDIREGEPQKK